MAIHELRAQRATAFDAFKALAVKSDFDPKKDQPEYDRLKAQVAALDGEIVRARELQEIESKGALVVAGQDNASRTWAAAKSDPYTNEAHAQAAGLGTHKGLTAMGIAKSLYMGGSVFNAPAAAKHAYGERHPVTEAVNKALAAGVGASGGFIIPPDYVNEIIELLRPRAVVRAANPRSMPMPRGTMTLPAQTAAATASYSGETAQISASQPQLGDIVATYKKLTSLVPVTNDLMRYADPAADAFVRDDMVKVTALREDLAFLLGDGTQDSPAGFLNFANQWVQANGGTPGRWCVASATTVSSALGWTSGNSTAAVDGPNYGNFITSTEGGSVTLTTVANELGGMVNKLDTANVPDIRRRWFFPPRIYNYLNNLLNSLGVYVYRDELSKGTLLGYPFSKSTQIPINVNDASSTSQNCTFIFLVEMDDALLLDSMSLELAVSREGTYYDANGVLQSAFQKDQTIIRGIMEHDFQMRHAASIAVDQFVTWTPAIS